MKVNQKSISVSAIGQNHHVQWNQISFLKGLMELNLNLSLDI